MASPVLAIFNSCARKMHAGAQAVLQVLQSGKAMGRHTQGARNDSSLRLLNGLEDDELDRLIAQADALVNQAEQLDTQALEAVMKQVRDLTAQATADAQIGAPGRALARLTPAQS
jgi:hypothetical protein